MKTIKHTCTVGDYTCPYCDDKQFCMLENPLADCDDYGYFYDEDEDEEGG